MAGNKTVSMTLNLVANANPAIATFNNLASVLKNKPIKISASVGKIDSANAQNAVDQIQAKAKSIDKIIIQTKTYIDQLGNEVNEPVKIIQEYTDKAGNAQKITEKLLDTLKNNPLYTPKGEGETKTTIIDSRSQAKLVEQERNKNMALMAAANKKAEEWSTRAQNMSKKEGAAIQAKAEKVQKLSIAYERAQKRGSSGSRILKQWELENKELDKQIDLTKRAATGVQGWAENIKRAFVQSVSYATSLGVLRLAQQALNQTIQFAIQLNKEMLNIQILQAEGAQTPNEIKSLASSFNELAKSLGATTLEVAQGSVEWLRQGKTIAETRELLKASTMMSKLGNLDAASSTEYLTSTLNSYKMSAEEAVRVVDKLVAVDNVAATSTRELATALRYSAAVAAEAGVELDQLISYIAVISSTTRLNAEQIGQAMKTMMTRMQDIKSGQIDSEGLGLNNVESALTRINVKLRDTQDTFRPLGDVLEDVAEKWNTLNDVEQANIAKAIAGVRQQNMFLILMQNMNKAIELQDVALKSNGLAMDRYGMYLESVEAAQNRFKASTEALFMSAEDLDKVIVRVLNTLSGLMDFIDKMGGLPVVIELAVVALLAFNAVNILGWLKSAYFAIEAFASMMISATAGTNGLSGALVLLETTNPLGWITLLVGAVAVLAMNMDSAAEAIEKATKRVRELKEEVQDSESAYKNVQNLTEEYRKLSAITGPTTEQQERLYEVVAKMKELMPSLTVSIDGYGRMLVVNKGQVDDLTASYLELLEAKRKALKDEAEKDPTMLATQVLFARKDALNHPDDPQKMVDYLEMLPKIKEQFALMGTDAREEFIKTLTLPGTYSEWGEEFATALVTQVENDMAVARADAYQARQDREDEDFRNELQAEKDRAEALARETGIGLKLNVKQFIMAVSPMKDAIADFKKVQDSILSGGDVDTGLLDKLGIKYELVGDNINFAEGEEQRFKDALFEEHLAYIDLSDEQEAYIRRLWEASDATSTETDRLAELNKAMSAVTSALSEQNDAGFITTKTAMDLISAHSSLIPYLYETANGFYLDADGARKALYAEMDLIFADNQLSAASVAAANGNYILAASLVATSDATDEVKAKLLDLLGIYSAMGAQVKISQAGGNAKSGKSAEEIAIEGQVKALEKKKDALKDTLDQFKDYITAQKESLRLAKEEKEFSDELLKKNLSLAKLKTNIAILALDDSEEARAQRIAMEEEAASLEEEISKDKEDRVYDLKIDALDKAEKAFEDNINHQMKLIEDQIERYRDQLSAIKDNTGAVGGLTSAIDTYGTHALFTVQDVIDKLAEQNVKIADANLAIKSMIKNWIDQGYTIDQVMAKVRNLLSAIASAHQAANELHRAEGGSWYNRNYHEGGVVESHHDGAPEFAGGKKSNEVFAKLLAGELVATEGQMDNFMTNILPSIASRASVTPTAKAQGSLEISMPITVMGNMDESVLPKMDAMVKKTIGQLNDNLINRGFTRTATDFSV